MMVEFEPIIICLFFISFIFSVEVIWLLITSIIMIIRLRRLYIQ